MLGLQSTCLVIDWNEAECSKPRIGLLPDWELGNKSVEARYMMLTDCGLGNNDLARG